MGRLSDEPNMSDAFLLVSVQDLIDIALGPANKNLVNYKLVQTILHIIARHLRLLEQRVEIRIEDERATRPILSTDEDDIDDNRHRRSKDTREKAGRSPHKDKQKQDRTASMDRRKTDKSPEKDKERSENVEKDKSKSEKLKEKEDKAYSKDQEKTDREEKEKSERAALKDQEGDGKTTAKKGDKGKEQKDKAAIDKDDEKDVKGKGKSDKTKDKEKVEREEKHKSKADKTSAKDEEKTGKGAHSTKERDRTEDKKEGRAKSKDRKGRTVSDTSIVISEVERQKEKVLVVEKGPTTRSDSRREGIEVVTRSQFDMVEAMVRELQSIAGPPPEPALPDNKKLRHDIAKGSASLTDTMQAMQVTARVRAAEQAISRMGDLLTQLAAAGALPREFAEQIEGVQFEPPDVDNATNTSNAAKARGTTVARKSVAIQEGFGVGEISGTRPMMQSRPSVASGTKSMMQSRISMTSTGMLPVTHPEMDEAMRALKTELMANVQNLTTKATTIAENANTSAKGVLEKLNVALALDDRLNTLNALVADYSEQLSGFDAGLTTQLQSFNDQMRQMRADMLAGLTQLENVNNNAETTAMMELTERCEGLASELEQTLIAHNNLIVHQRQLGDELHSLVECIEMLREQKADRDEVLDGLRDKADNHRLAGLLTTAEFLITRSDLEKRLEVCYDKFQRQEIVWMTALKDLMVLVDNKAEVTQLLSARHQTEEALSALQLMQENLALVLGEPKAAVTTRALSRGASCGVCLVPALMEPTDASYGAPPPLPAMRSHPVGAEEEPCLPEWKPPDLPDHREHSCQRWCGGSHTLLAPLSRERAPPAPLLPPARKYTGYGSDGRLYMLEEELQPCLECNQFLGNVVEETPHEEGAGDQGKIQIPMKNEN